MSRREKIVLLAAQVLKNTLAQPSAKVLILATNVLLITVLLVGFFNLTEHFDQTHALGSEVREQWENSPDKHPHRMAHYGYLVFREKFPLAFFDYGLDSYLGNVIFLEAHKQNTVNFSEANLSNGLLRFGELSAGMVLQVLVPLLIFFWGYDLISRDREQGTLKILFTQGVTGLELVWGRVLGLFLVSLSLIGIPVLLGFALLFFHPETELIGQSFLQYFVLIFGYLIYFLILCLIAAGVSSKSQSSKASLISLIGCWLMFTLIIPKVAQVVGQAVYPTPSKIEFDTAVEEELIRQGDSHNPNDPHYAALKDSLLRAYGVDSTKQLPFNYSGYVMREGERLSTQTFLNHQKNLVDQYKSQHQVIGLASWLDPFLAIKKLSMGFSGTDYEMYLSFQDQAEAYRYQLAQTMNELQIELISNRVNNSSDPAARLSSDYWEQFPDFHPRFLSADEVSANQLDTLLVLVLWMALLAVFISYLSNRINVF
ncbi:ABC transporter permease [Algoriphagus aquatilis]|uniref:ABC transporter permease n=1 Tax=Algoriphagus aquatilis TaxID=490186 RepID=A0ABW0C250_9BACT